MLYKFTYNYISLLRFWDVRPRTFLSHNFSSKIMPVQRLKLNENDLFHPSSALTLSSRFFYLQNQETLARIKPYANKT
jgi:hypothetical protein